MVNTLAFLGGAQEWLIVALIILVLFGGKKIPELMRGVGKGVGELQKGLDEGRRAMHHATQEEDEPKAPTTDVPAPQAK